MTTLESKPHFDILDALRGVAALIVIWYHCNEGFATSIVDQACNHGYLAVDFFFILSGFVIGYAYDDRLRNGSLSVGSFFKRRLVRLHPMVVFGVLFGVLCFIIGGCRNWAGETVGIGWVMIAMLLNMLMLPVVPGMRADIRGNGEMFPLNGPHWSLFFEYIGNIIYVLLLRKLPSKILAVLTAVLGAVLAWITISNGYLGVGWTLPEFWSGLVRMLFPYCAGMLLARCFMARREKGLSPVLPSLLRRYAFIVCALVLLVLLPMPFVGSEAQLWQNGIYVTAIILLVFPALIWLAAEGSEFERVGWRGKAMNLLGEISYPLYAIHYPVMYLFFAYIGFPEVHTTMRSQWPVALAIALFCVVSAYLVLRFYDKPLRKKLLK